MRLKLLGALGRERMDLLLCSYGWVIDKFIKSFGVEFG